jgi:hypothetical protein
VVRPVKVSSLAIFGCLVALALAWPARAAPNDSPCSMAVSLLCHFVPMAPDLDGDVDLTTQLPAGDPGVAVPPADPCVSGCI